MISFSTCMIDLPFSFLKRKVQASEQVPNAFCCSTTRGFATQFSATMNYMMMLPGPFYQGYRGRIWRTVIVALALLVVGGLALVRYPPAQYTFDVIHRFAPILYWAFFVLFLVSLFWPRPK
jgi:hypothetical protein